MTLSLIAALAKNRVIGRDGDIPWRIPEDWQHFKRVTTGHPIIMGRKTYQSIGKPLAGRTNIVVTRNRDLEIAGSVIKHSLEDALAFAAPLSSDEVFVIGGERLYTDALPKANKLYLTLVDLEVEGDTFFPAYDDTEWLETERQENSSERGKPAFTFVTLERR